MASNALSDIPSPQEGAVIHAFDNSAASLTRMPLKYVEDRNILQRVLVLPIPGLSRLPALTRESTGTAYETVSLLLTPFDNHPPTSRKAEYTKNRTRAFGRSTFDAEDAERDLDDAQEDSRSSYFPDIQSPFTPSRRSSTKDLIHRYESLSAACRPTTPTTPRSQVKYSASVPPSPGFSRRDSPLPPTPTPTPTLSRPLPQLLGRSPLRESFRNLMVLFGKKGKSKSSSSPASSGYISEAFLADHSSPGVASLISPATYQASPVIEQSPPALKSGPVLYLFPQQSDGTLPVWSDCTASLYPDRILIKWLSAFGNPSQHSIRLAPSANVQSLTWSQVDHTERMLLPDEAEDAHVFEIDLGNNVREKFATKSVADRSAWVSTIWDALLQLRTEEAPATTLMYTTLGDFRRPESHSATASNAESIHSRSIEPEVQTGFAQARSNARPSLTTSQTFSSQTLVGSVPQSAIGSSNRSPSTYTTRSVSSRAIDADSSRISNTSSSPVSANICMKPNSTQLSHSASKASNNSGYAPSYQVSDNPISIEDAEQSQSIVDLDARYSQLYSRPSSAAVSPDRTPRSSSTTSTHVPRGPAAQYQMPQINPPYLNRRRSGCP